MRKCKRLAAVLLCGTSLLVNPAYAFWPVFDFTEIVPILEQIKTTKESLDESQETISNVNKTREAIGGVGNVNGYMEDIETSDKEEVIAFSNKTSKTHEESVQLASLAPQIIAGAFSSVTTAQANSINSFVDTVEGKIFKTPTSQSIVVSYNDIQPLLFVEEEEEEEVSAKSIEVKQEELATELNAVMTENKQLAVELNDILESLLTSLNQAAIANNASLAELDNVVKNTNIIQDADKERLKKQIEALSVKQQDMADRTTALIEDIQNNYNETYNNVIKDGTGNYVKTAVAYLRGDEEKETVAEAGQKLKKEIGELNVVLNGDNLNEIEATTKEILLETEKLKEEMQELLTANSNNKK